MDVLWDQPDRELTGRDVLDVLPDYAYTTVATVLDRLTRKGLVRRKPGGRALRFAAAGTRAAHTAELMHEALVVGREPHDSLVSFAATMSPSEAEVLRRALTELERNRKSARRG